MDKPRLVVRFTVALLAFVIGITSTLLVNYLWPGGRAHQEVRYELRLAAPHRAPQADGPCPYREPTMQHAYVWTPEAPPPPEPPPPPPPPQRPRLRATR